MILQALGLRIIFIGLSGSLSQMLVIKGNSLTARGSILLIITLALGTAIGELLDLDAGFNHLGDFLTRHFHNSENNQFSLGFITSTLTVSIGVMAIVGSLQDGLNHDPSILFIRSTIDCITVVLFAAVYGIGCAFAALPTLIFEGGITLLATLIKPLLTAEMFTGISLVGNTLIALIGLNMLLASKIKVANLLPAILLVPFYLHFWGLG
ncbi:DUF554 domain-containing protein [Lactobacillus sp. DCY120]|uniref:DUF554 domain-containing protein n=1 Tax=Bombilactobacillus apium TaxID=2675299 RepID=A0A850R5G9_9LACO|nr:DUF554 domain-containing protein [Bombilactobacillus apium]NVY96097.1 DUF554 domain-containing protein [Bombilactobacillus apium]